MLLGEMITIVSQVINVTIKETLPSPDYSPVFFFPLYIINIINTVLLLIYK